ncbi:PREDICTED: ankyrin-3-like [Wasmannia auropunctata]|uniref:ankyrin-3-like n=1 Tax=Wasmannia auropunctata TaxID=64793 RepID=UPI0005EDCD58|nr:PREDICTED: ankyrin-3-like [Wasmannia auropunctata]
MSSNREQPPGNENDKKNPSSKEDSPSDDKEDSGSASTGSNGGATTEEPSQPGSKPSSVGATVKEEAQKLLGLAARKEWAVVDQLLKSLEETVQSTGEDGFIVSLAGVLDTTTGMTPLMYAVEDNRSELLDRMIELGSDVNARNNANMVRKLLTHIPKNVKSDSPIGGFLVGELGVESGMTSLHLAAYSGNEKVIQFLLNSTGVQVDAATKENGWNPLHLACFGGHITVVGLLLSRSAELLHSSDRYGKTGLHIAATHGHYQMVKALLGQQAEINATDKNGWTPLHCAAHAGHLDVVKLLVESGGSPKIKTNLGYAPIWFAASEGHSNVLKYLMKKEHDEYALMEDGRCKQEPKVEKIYNSPALGGAKTTSL